MPTAAKLVAALVLAACAIGVSLVLIYRFDYFAVHGLNWIVFAGVGAFVGWWRLGPEAEKGFLSGWSGGIASALTCYLMVVAIGTGAFILRGMDRHTFKDLEDLTAGTFSKFFEYSVYLFDWHVFTVTVFAGLTAGTISAMAGRVWR